MSCTAVPAGTFEWCVNAPAVDARGTVYANSEDGNLYRIAPGCAGAIAFALEGEEPHEPHGQVEYLDVEAG